MYSFEILVRKSSRRRVQLRNQRLRNPQSKKKAQKTTRHQNLDQKTRVSNWRRKGSHHRRLNTIKEEILNRTNVKGELHAPISNLSRKRIKVCCSSPMLLPPKIHALQMNSMFSYIYSRLFRVFISISCTEGLWRPNVTFTGHIPIHR